MKSLPERKAFFDLGLFLIQKNHNNIEFKWNPNSKKDKIPKSFTNHYPDAITQVITPENYMDFLL